MARAVANDCLGTGEYLFCLPDVAGRALAIGAPLPGFPELVVVELRTGSGLLPAYLRAVHREHMGGMARVAVRPEWAGIIDFEQRLPSAIERAAAAMRAGG
jgi:hypothetical protein